MKDKGNEMVIVYFVKFSNGFNNFWYYKVVIFLESFFMFVEVRLEDGVFLEVYVRYKIKLIVIEYSFNVVIFKFEFCN